MIHLFNKTEYSPFLQLSELNTQLSQTNQLKYAASAQPTQKNTAFTQLIRRSEKKPQYFYSFNAGLKKTQLLRSFFKKAAEKQAFTQLLRRAVFNFGKGKYFAPILQPVTGKLLACTFVSKENDDYDIYLIKSSTQQKNDAEQ